jgi:hypothetical protein
MREPHRLPFTLMLRDFLPTSCALLAFEREKAGE